MSGGEKGCGVYTERSSLKKDSVLTGSGSLLTLADLFGPVFAEDERAAWAADLGDIRPAICSYSAAPGNREAEPVHVEAERCLDVGNMKHGACEPLSHKKLMLTNQWVMA